MRKMILFLTLAMLISCGGLEADAPNIPDSTIVPKGECGANGTSTTVFRDECQQINFQLTKPLDVDTFTVDGVFIQKGFNAEVGTYEVPGVTFCSVDYEALVVKGGYETLHGVLNFEPGTTYVELLPSGGCPSAEEMSFLFCTSRQGEDLGARLDANDVLKTPT